MDVETARYFSWITGALLLYILVCVFVGLFTEQSRKSIRWIALSALFAAGLVSIFCGLLYYWQHFVRVG